MLDKDILKKAICKLQIPQMSLSMTISICVKENVLNQKSDIR